MTVYYFVEDDDSAEDYKKGSAIVLTPWAAAALKTRGVPYSLLEDYYSETELRSDEDSFFYDQLKWFDQFDEFLANRFPEAREFSWKLASIHYNRLKYLIDSFLIRIYVIESFFKKTIPSEIIHLATMPKAEPPASIYEFSRRDRWSYGVFLESITRHHQISFKKRICQAAPIRQPYLTWTPTLLKKLFKRVMNFIPYGKGGSAKKKSHLNLVSLDSGTPAHNQLVLDLLRAGHKVFLKQKNTLSPLNKWRGDRFSLNPQPPRMDAETLTADFMDSEFFAWIQNRSSIGLKAFLRPYFLDFFANLLPKVVAEAKSLMGFYHESSINAVLARTSVGENYPAALLAASTLGIPRICFQHSIGPGDLKDLTVDELAFFDYNFAISQPSADYFSHQAASNPKFQHCRVIESSHHLRDLAKKVSPGQPEGIPPTLIYCVTKLARGMSRFNTMSYPMSWYFEHQIKVMTYLASIPGYQVIYKHAAGQDWANQSILPWLKSKKFKNVSIRKEPLTEVLPEADKIFFDYPSTGLFEAAICGFPVLALHHEAMRIWPAMNKVFGKSLQCFKTSEEAIFKLDHFLKAPAFEYKVSLPLHPMDPAEALIRCFHQNKNHVKA